jgi:hypothetical protein
MSTKHHHLVTSAFIKKAQYMSYSLNYVPLHSIFTSQPGYSLMNHYYGARLVASCDSLLCFAIDQHLAFLHNPSIRTSKNFLPYLEIPRQHGITTYAFGYDHLINSYKVVSVFHYRFDTAIRYIVGYSSY